MAATESFQIWSDFLDKCRATIAELRARPSELRQTITTPISYDTGRPPGNPRVEAIVTIASWLGLLVGGLATIITAFFTTGTVFFVLLGITLLSLLVVLWERFQESRHSGPWFREAEVTTGCLLIANQALYESGGSMLPGGMMVTFDDELARDVDRLRGLAQKFLSYCGADTDAPLELREAVEFLDSDIETPSFTRYRLPREFTGNDQTYLVCMGMDQQAMPKGKLDRDVWPVFGRDDKNEPVVIVNHRLWYRADSPAERIAGVDSA